MKSISPVILFLLFLLAIGCNDEPTNNTNSDDMTTDMADMSNDAEMTIEVPDDAPTFHRDIRPLMTEHCAGCHKMGGVAPFVMDYDPMEWTSGAPWWAASAAQSVAQKTMPPWQPTQDCRPLQGVRAMDETAVASFAQWAKYNFPEGDPMDYVEPNKPQQQPATLTEQLGQPTLSLGSPQPYAPSTDYTDDYRCFVLDASFDETSFIRAVNVNVDKRAIVHHVIVYLIPPDDVPGIEQRDARDEGAGYTCYGGPGGNNNRNIGGWVPGAQGTALSEGLAHVVPKGSKLVLQMHYNTLNIKDTEQVPADQTNVDIWLYPQGQTPTHEVRVIPFANLELEIAPGEAASKHVRDYRFPFDATLIGVTAHMHTLGKSIKLEHNPQNQPDQNTCALDIPAWDFNWQQSYTFQEGKTIALKKGDILRQSCVFDNSPENQAIIQGKKMMPRYVFWGDGTLDEMCLTYAIIQRPYVAGQGTDCSLNQTCIEQCEKHDGECLMRCGFYTSGECASCAFDDYFSCGVEPCISEAISLQTCTNNCAFENNLLCLKKECQAQWDAFAACATPKYKDKTCEITTCGGAQ